MRAPCIFLISIIYRTPLWCRIAELVPHFTQPSGLHCTCYSLVYSWATRCLCLAFAQVLLSSTTAAVQMSGFLLLFWAPHNC